MSGSVLVAALWVLAATGVALLPLRRQYLPGLALLLAAPVVILLLGLQHGWLAALAALAAVLSMFRAPLRALWGRWRSARSRNTPLSRPEPPR